MITRSIEFVRRHVVCLFCVLVLVGMALHALTLPYSPVHWMDEVMINEAARGGILHKNADWSMVWYMDESVNQKSWLICYLGGWVLEEGYQMLGHLGPRIMTTGWLFIITVLAAFYFHHKLKGWGISCLLGLIVFAFPGLVQSARGARVDVIALAFIFAALSALQFIGGKQWKNLVAFALCGIFCAMAFFTWQPAGMLYPLVLWEVAEQLIDKKMKTREMFILLLVAALFFLLSVILIMYPFWDNFWHRLFGASATVGRMAESSKDSGWHWREYFKALFGLPWVFCFGFTALFLKRRLWFLAVAMVGLSLLCVATKVYVFRMLYLMPYAIVGLGVLVASWRNNRLKHRIGIGLLSLMVVLSFGWSVVLRNFTEYFTQDFRDYEKMCQTLEKEIGRDVYIYLDMYQAYYIGRELGWHQFNVGHTEFLDVDADFFKRVDYVLLDEKWVNQAKFDRLAGVGFLESKLICADIKNPISRIEKLLDSNQRLYPLGPFRLFWRKKDALD